MKTLNIEKNISLVPDFYTRPPLVSAPVCCRSSLPFVVAILHCHTTAVEDEMYCWRAHFWRSLCNTAESDPAEFEPCSGPCRSGLALSATRPNKRGSLARIIDRVPHRYKNDSCGFFCISLCFFDFSHFFGRFSDDLTWELCYITSWLEFVDYIKNQSLPTVDLSSNQGT